MATVKDSIDVDLPLPSVYSSWSRFEDFPHFMEGIEEVRKLDDMHHHWRAKVAGKHEEWDSEVTEEIPDKRIAWRSTSGHKNDGVVEFEPISPTSTRIHLKLDYEPSGVGEKIGGMLGLDERKVKKDLKQFKDYVEHGKPH